MIIDKILDRYDGDAYDPEDFYNAMMSYEEGTDFPISRALDSGEEEDIKRELCAYIDDGNYNPKIKVFINSVKWLEADDGKDYSKEFDILGEAKKGESKKNESVYGTVRVDSEDIAIKVQESNVYPSSSGRSLSGDVPKVESWFSTLSEFSDCIDGMAEDCNGYPDISRDGSDILVKINAPMEDENGEFNGDYEVIVELRCSTEITNGSLDGVVDLLNHE